jgi:flagellar biosynthetic protein FliR
MRWRLLLAAAITLVLGPVLPAGWQLPRAGGTLGLPYLALLLGSELMLGIMVSLFVHVMFEIFSFAGTVVGIDMAFEFAQQVDPTLEQQSSAMSVFMTQMFTLVFVSLGGIELLVQVAALSVRRLPPGTAATATVGLPPLIACVGQMFATGFQIALPIFCVALLVNVALGLMTRFGEEFEVLMLAFPVRIAVGFFVMAAAIPVWVHLAGRLVHHTFGQIARMLSA